VEILTKSHKTLNKSDNTKQFLQEIRLLSVATPLVHPLKVPLAVPILHGDNKNYCRRNNFSIKCMLMVFQDFKVWNVSPGVVILVNSCNMPSHHSQSILSQCHPLQIRKKIRNLMYLVKVSLKAVSVFLLLHCLIPQQSLLIQVCLSRRFQRLLNLVFNPLQRKKNQVEIPRKEEHKLN